MRFRLSVCAFTLAIAAGSFTPAYAQTPAQPPATVRHVIDSTAMQSAVHQKAAAETADRAAILDALRLPEAQAVAKHLGLTPSHVEDAVQTMSPADVEAFAPTARMANDAQAGGDISISLTALLLLLILLVLIVK